MNKKEIEKEEQELEKVLTKIYGKPTPSNLKKYKRIETTHKCANGTIRSVTYRKSE